MHVIVHSGQSRCRITAADRQNTATHRSIDICQPNRQTVSPSMGRALRAFLSHAARTGLVASIRYVLHMRFYKQYTVQGYRGCRSSLCSWPEHPPFARWLSLTESESISGLCTSGCYPYDILRREIGSLSTTTTNFVSHNNNFRSDQ